MIQNESIDAYVLIFSDLEILLFGLDLSSYWVFGNWAQIGLPFVKIGIGVAKFIDSNKDTITYRRGIGYYAISILTIVNFLWCFLLDQRFNMYLSYTSFTLVINFIIFIMATDDTVSEKNVFTLIGKYLTKHVFLWHSIFISTTNFAYTFLRINEYEVALYLHPIISASMTLFFLTILSCIAIKIKGERTNLNTKTI